MGQTLTYKILQKHLVEGELKAGSEIAIKIDQTLTQDATGTMAFLQFESMNIPKVNAELSVSYVDHNMLQDGFENADDHKYLQSAAAKYGVYFSRAGNGICHQVHLERFGLPGKTLLGSDSHTCTGGGIGMIAIGAGGLDVALAMAGRPFYLTCPKVLNVKLSGKLQGWVSAKDVILTLLQKLTTKGNVGWIVEYSGDGVKTLSVPERATITNMGAELGVTTSVFPSDEVTLKFLKAQARDKGWVSLAADDSAVYDKVIEMDLSKIIPMVAKPHSPDNVVCVKDIAGLKVDQVMIGSCTNSSYRDLRIVGGLLKGRRINKDVSVGLAPGSRQVLEMISSDGTLADVIASGARVLESACGFCIGLGQAPRTNAVSVRTNNRNFEGRSGTKSAGIYLVSPETAAVCAIKGEFIDPREAGLSYPKVDEPKSFYIDDGMIIPPADGGKAEIYRGPNIGEPPRLHALPNDLAGEILLKVGDKITTDHIMPAGSRLKYRSNIPKYAEFVFEGIDPAFSKRALETKKKGRAVFIAAGASYGQGSSREHAAICPAFLGVAAVMAKSFERIHAANLVNFGIIPLIFANEADYETINVGGEIKISGVKKAIESGSDVIIETGGKKITLKYNLSDRQRKIIIAGGALV
ncbi:MAG: aconitate hydratase [Deltaproteobacteria bacterium]|nr:aconitate hydratase [Deltaproteobacteria bacterium]